MNSQPRVAILLSTYNGESYLREQLDSLFAQTYSDFVILARDDGSRDASIRILGDYAIRYPEKLRVIKEQAGNLGASGSFAWLLRYALENKEMLGLEPLYLMFCDQDDCWYEDKITKQMNALLACEAENLDSDGKPLPILIHSDLQVVGENLQPIAESLARYQGLETKRNSFPNLVISNLVTGCTALFNEALARKALPISTAAIMHDWWLALVASAFGKVVYLDTPLIRYRQHGSNTIGAKQREQRRVTSVGFWKRIMGPAANSHLIDVAHQAKAFRQQYEAELDAKQRRALRYSAAMAIRVGFLQRLFFRIARRL